LNLVEIQNRPEFQFPSTDVWGKKHALLLSEVVVSSGEYHLVLVLRTKSGDLLLDNLTSQTLVPRAPSLGSYSKAGQFQTLGDDFRVRSTTISRS
jgi:hypothetical protein